ncbi:hypothetical protein [Poriferisphaera sp. WC338]|uniref:hypothetical protein n=1 Tax=Poriferisphaera sp. WC338 TaxID=3425129 RepID=UPI003D81A3EE
MSKLELECPGCESVLRLDKAFAGGVCRCSHCGMLMSVPKHPTAHGQITKVQAVQRPESPGEGVGTEHVLEAQVKPPQDEKDTDETAGSHWVGVLLLALAMLIIIAGIIVAVLYMNSAAPNAE